MGSLRFVVSHLLFYFSSLKNFISFPSTTHPTSSLSYHFLICLSHSHLTYSLIHGYVAFSELSVCISGSILPFSSLSLFLIIQFVDFIQPIYDCFSYWVICNELCTFFSHLFHPHFPQNGHK